MKKLNFKLVSIMLGLALLLVYVMPAVPSAVAKPENPAVNFNLISYQGEDEEEEEGVISITQILGVSPELMEAQSGCPYDQLRVCLNLIIPPLEPVCMVLPNFLGAVVAILGALLDNPEIVAPLLREVFDLIVDQPAVIINLIDLLIAPLSLRLCNPVNCIQDPTMVGLCEGINIQHPFTSCLGGVGVILATIISGLPITPELAGAIPALPSLLGLKI